MDCQTESYADVEMLKDKRRFKCDHCAESLPASSTNHSGEQTPFPSNANIELYSGSTEEYPFESSISEPNEDEVLEISLMPAIVEISDSSEIDEVILLPLDESKTAPSKEDPHPTYFNSEPKALKTVIPESSQKLPFKPIPGAESSTRKANSSDSQRLPEKTLPDVPGGLKRLKVVTVSTSMLMGVAGAFVLFISLGNMIITSRGNDSSNTGNPTRTVSPPSQEIKQNAPLALSEPPEATKPIPTPTPPVIENKPADETPSTNQSSVAEKGQFTVQVGSHNDVSQADGQAEKLRAAGFEPRVVSVDIPKRGRWYRVQAGSFNNRDEANRYGAQIVAKGAAANFVISGL